MSLLSSLSPDAIVIESIDEWWLAADGSYGGHYEYVRATINDFEIVESAGALKPAGAITSTQSAVDNANSAVPTNPAAADRRAAGLAAGFTSDQLDFLGVD